MNSMSEQARASFLAAASESGVNPYNKFLPMRLEPVQDGKYVLVNGAGYVLGSNSMLPNDAPTRARVTVPDHIKPVLLSAVTSIGALGKIQHSAGVVAHAGRTMTDKHMVVHLAEMDWMPEPPDPQGNGMDALEFGRVGFDDPYYGTSKHTSAGEAAYAGDYVERLGVLIDAVLVPHLQQPQCMGIAGSQQDALLHAYAMVAGTWYPGVERAAA